MLQHLRKWLGWGRPAPTVDELFQAKACLGQGVECLARGEIEQALAAFTRALEFNPDDADAYYRRGGVWLDRRQDPNRAIADFSEAIARCPEHERCHYQRGNAYLDQGDYDRAIADFTVVITEFGKLARVLDEDPERSLLNGGGPPDETLQAQAYYNRGKAFLAQGSWERAVGDFSQVIELTPQDPEAFTNRAVAHARQGDQARALADCDEALRLDPKHVTAYINRALSHGFQGAHERTIADCTQALALDANRWPAFKIRGTAWFHQQQFEQAVSDFTAALRLQPQRADLYELRAAARRGAGDAANAAADERQAKALSR